MVNRLAAVAVIGLGLLVTFSVTADVPAEPFRYPEGRHGKGTLRYRAGLPVLTVAGTPQEIGEQIAYLAARYTPRLYNYPKDLLTRFGFGGLWPQAVAVGSTLLPQFPEHHRAELEAVAAAGERINVPRELIIAGNTLFDVKKLVACSSLLVAPEKSKTGGILFGRNLDFPTLGYLHEYSLVLAVRGQGKRPFVAVGFPGLIGVLTGINDAGLTLATHEVYTSADGGVSFNPKGVPYALTFRRVLEECATIEEAVELLRSLPRTTANNLAICQADGTCAILEQSTQSVALRPTHGGSVACTNHFHLPGLANAKQANTYRTVERYALLSDFQSREKLGVEDVAAALHAVNLGMHTMQTMVFEPQARRLHLVLGPTTPVSAYPLRTLDLAPLLSGE